MTPLYYLTAIAGAVQLARLALWIVDQIEKPRRRL